MASKSQPMTPPLREGSERRGLVRMLSKVKTALKRSETSMSRKSAKSTATPAPVTTANPNPVVGESETAPVVATTTTTINKTEQTTKSKAAEARARYEGMQGVSKQSRSALFEDRAKKLSERFGLEIRPSEWQNAAQDDTVLRIDKPIRMRVRRTCHRCNATFSAAKECPNCQHLRCTKCTRYPPKRTEDELVASREKRAAITKANKENAPIVPDYAWEEKNYVLKRPSRTGGQDLIHKKPRQRVRRTCHQCATLFMAGSKRCEKCSHARCTDCPRDPPKKDKYPFGYPGDEFGPNSVPHYECGRCQTLYPTGAEDGTECRKCRCPKSDKSPRAKPRKVEPLPDPEILKQIQTKLDNLRVA